MVNNVIYNWTHHNATKIGDGARVNVINNNYIPGPQSTDRQACILPETPDQGTKVYVSGNVSHLTPTGKEEQWVNLVWFEPAADGWITHEPAPDVFRAEGRFQAPLVATHSAQEAYKLVLSHVGPKVRDADDIRVIQEVRDRTGHVGRGPR